MFGIKRKMPETQYDKLVKEYDDLRSRIKEADSKNDTAFNPDDLVRGAYIGFTLDVVDEFRERGVELDFSVESIKLIDQHLNELHDSIATETPPEEAIINKAKGYGGYVGTVLLLHTSTYHWSSISRDLKDYASITITDGSRVWLVVQKVYKQLTNGPEDSIWFFANHILGKAKPVDLGRSGQS